MKSLLIMMFMTQVHSAPTPPDVLERLKSNVEKETTSPDERHINKEEYIQSHRYDVPYKDEVPDRRSKRDKEKGHGRDNLK